MAPPASKFVLTCKANLDWLTHQIMRKFEHLLLSRESADYKVWQDQFMWRRLGLCIWGAIPLWCCGTANDLYFMFCVKKAAFSQELNSSVMQDMAVAPLLLTLLMLYRSNWGHRYPSLIFLSLSWSGTLLQELFATLNGFALQNDDMWRLVFMAQATLIPVRWHLHLGSQLGVLVYYVGVNSALGLNQIEGHPLVSVGWLLMIFWFCFICNLGVYLYERLQRAEFESRRELRVFLHAISHDLRTTVMGTDIVLQNLLKKSPAQVSVKNSVLERLRQGSQRQLNLINSLLEAHALEAHGVVLQLEPLQMGTVVQAVLCDLEPFFTQNRVILQNLVSANLPLVHADATHLGRVVSNLLSNALKHNPYGITLTLDASVKDKMLLCRVQDNGVGMSQQQCARAFELYTRGEKARFRPGLGLGLYVCRQIITAHGGQIGVTSRVGAGSTFWFTLPLCPVGFRSAP